MPNLLKTKGKAFVFTMSTLLILYILGSSWKYATGSERQILKNNFKERLQRVKDVCEEEPAFSREGIAFISTVFNIDHEHKLLMCRTTKHGTTTWAYNFVQMYTKGIGAGPRLSKYSIARQLIELHKTKVDLAEKEEAIHALETSKHEYSSFFVCRNPLDSLSSVYRMKQEQLQSKIKKNLIKFPSWEEFITSVSKEGRVGCEGCGKDWLPNTHSMFEKCHPCHYKYDAVIMMESFDEDSRIILDSVGAGWIATTHQNDRGLHQLKQTDVEKLFQNVTKPVIEAIIKRYYMDFRICGYEETLRNMKRMIE